jgi:hypothetical protein
MDSKTSKWIPKQFINIVIWMERILAISVLVGIVLYSFGSILILAGMDWKLTETFYELIYRVLLIVIGLELVRMLIVHDLSAVLELLAFVTARKVLKPDIEAIDIVLAIIAFVALLGARRYFLETQSYKQKDNTHHSS